MPPSPDLAEQHAAEQAPLEAVIKGEVLRMYQEVADNPRQEFHFFHGREAAEMFGYEGAWLDRATERPSIAAELDVIAALAR